MNQTHKVCAAGTSIPMAYVENMAVLAHEMNRHASGLMDEDMHEWENAPQWQRDTAIEGVMNFLDNPMMTPAETHELWMEDKRKEGWSYGLKKCDQAKEHPCMKPYNQLTAEQKVKDYVFLASLHLTYEKWVMEIHPEIESRRGAHG